MLESFKSFIKEKNLFAANDKILLAVSGGIDSMVMMHLFSSCDFIYGVAHCNFKLREKESDDDEKFVRQEAKFSGVKFYSKSFNTKKYSDKNNLSIQMAARKLRYDFFEEIRAKHQYDYIAVAHNAGDSAETVLLTLIRGTGIAGHHGILPKNNFIVRPLLFASREDILQFAKAQKIKWREDSSNRKNDYPRNSIRNQVMPVLKKINPSVNETLLRHAEDMHGVEQLYRQFISQLRQNAVEEKNDETIISIPFLQKQEGSLTLLHEILKEYGFNRDAVHKINGMLSGEAGKIFLSPTHRLVKDRKYLMVTKRSPVIANDYLIEAGNHFFQWEGGSLSFRKIMLTSDLKEKIIAGEMDDNNVAWMDAGKLIYPLQLRHWKKGDVFHPLGMRGNKKISDFFTDLKYSALQKEKAWLLCSANKIAWVAGERMDDKFKITASTGTSIEIVFEKA